MRRDLDAIPTLSSSASHYLASSRFSVVRDGVCVDYGPLLATGALRLDRLHRGVEFSSPDPARTAANVLDRAFATKQFDLHEIRVRALATMRDPRYKPWIRLIARTWQVPITFRDHIEYYGLDEQFMPCVGQENTLFTFVIKNSITHRPAILPGEESPARLHKQRVGATLSAMISAGMHVLVILVERDDLDEAMVTFRDFARSVEQEVYQLRADE